MARGWPLSRDGVVVLLELLLLDLPCQLLQGDCGVVASAAVRPTVVRR